MAFYPDNFSAKLRFFCTEAELDWISDENKTESQKAWAVKNLTDLNPALDTFLTVRIQARGISFESTDEDFKAALALELENAYLVREGEYVFAPATVVPAGKSLLGLTWISFLNRFTAAELIALYTAAASNVAIQVYKDKVLAASFIDLTRSDTIAGVNALVTAGVLTAERASAILTDPMTDEEKYFG